MFSKAKRFEAVVAVKSQSKTQQKKEPEKSNIKTSSNTKSSVVSSKDDSDARSQCSSAHSTKSFKTPRPLKTTYTTSKTTSSSKKTFLPSAKNINHKKNGMVCQEDLIKAHDVEIRNKDYTLSEYNKQIDDLKNELAKLHKRLQENNSNKDMNRLDSDFINLTLEDNNVNYKNGKIYNKRHENDAELDHLNYQILELQKQSNKLEQELNNKQVELTGLEEIITIRDSLCADLQNKLTDMESCLEETRQRFEMVKGHHALALEANESIRREYKAELETLKLKLDEEKQSIVTKCKTEQENLKLKYNALIESIKKEMFREKDHKINELEHELTVKEQEIKAKLEQVNEATSEKLRLCEIQFEERTKHLQEHWTQQQKQIECLESEVKTLKHSLNSTEEQKKALQKEFNILQEDNEVLKSQKFIINKELENYKENTKKKHIDFENKINKLTVEVDRLTKDKNKFEMSLSVTRDIVEVLTSRLRESDNELENLESQILTLKDSKEVLESELLNYKTILNNTVLECNEYKEALVNILKSKAALAKEHNRIIEHNVSLIESLQNVEKEAYRELGTIKNELIEDVELIKKESTSQIEMLKEQVEKKRVMCELATEHAAQTAAAAECARTLLARAATDIARLEADNHSLQQQIQDQQSLVVELSLLRQENEELTMTLAKQSSVMDKMKKEVEHVQAKPKSPSMIRKPKIGKENIPTIISPLRERNH